MATKRKNFKELYENAKSRAANLGRTMRESAALSKAAAGVGALAGGFGGTYGAGRASLGKSGDDELGVDAAPVVSAAVLAVGLAVPGPAGVGTVSAGGAGLGGFLGMRMRLKELELYDGFRESTLGAKEDE